MAKVRKKNLQDHGAYVKKDGVKEDGQLLYFDEDLQSGW